MKVKFYVDWENREVIASKERLDQIKKSYIEQVENDKLAFAGEYLEDLHLSLTEILYATESQRWEWEKGIEQYIKDIAMDNFNDDYEEIEVEI